jgi:hypothetical protein
MSRSFRACCSISCRRDTSSFRALFSSMVGAMVSKHCFRYSDVFSMLYNTIKDQQWQFLQKPNRVASGFQSSYLYLAH